MRRARATTNTDAASMIRTWVRGCSINSGEPARDSNQLFNNTVVSKLSKPWIARL